MKIKLALIVATLFAAQAAIAGNVYVGAGFGQSRLHADLGKTTSSDLKDTTGKVLVGKQLNRNFAIEGSYFDLGDFSAATRYDRASVGARGLGLDLVGTLPVTQRLDVLGRVGVTRSRIDGELNGFSDHKNVTNPKAGLGLQYKLTDNLAVRGEYEAYRTNASYAGYKERSHVNTLGASLVYKFGGKPVAAPRAVPVVYTPAPVAAAPVATTEPVAPAVEAPVVTTKKVRE